MSETGSLHQGVKDEGELQPSTPVPDQSTMPGGEVVEDSPTQQQSEPELDAVASEGEGSDSPKAEAEPGISDQVTSDFKEEALTGNLTDHSVTEVRPPLISIKPGSPTTALPYITEIL